MVLKTASLLESPGELKKKKKAPMPGLQSLLIKSVSLEVRPGHWDFLKLIFIGVELIYNAVLVSAVQQSESVTHKHISTLY